MDWNQVEGNWKNLKGQIRSKWAKLTDDDSEFIKGSKDQLLGKIQERYGSTKDRVKMEVEEWLKSI